ncbi:MAG: GspH/FimT family pseudopilin [Marinagarivorans sp.]|nr:GspH/FimT family pseudopilin [Marinagarivorans sp.]
MYFRTNTFHGRARGFTLIELMVAVAVLAILISMAVPSFTAQIQRNKMRSTTADLIVAVAHARSEAVTRATTLYVHPKTINNTAAWANGWCVSTLSSGCGVAGTTLIREFDGPRGISLIGSVTTAGAASASKPLEFNSLGHRNNSITANTFSICSASSTLGKKIEILDLGQALVQDCTCSSNVCN